jgi:hypothetical protein
MSGRVRKPDDFRGSRQAFAVVVLVLDFLFFVPFFYGLVQLVAERDEDRDPAGPLPWLLYAAQYVFIAASVVPAVRIFRTEDRRKSWQLTGWMALLFLVGIGIAYALAVYIDNRDSIAG